MSSSLFLARRNAAALVFFLYFQEIIWFAFSRIFFSQEGHFYNVAPFDWLYFFCYVVLAVFLGLLSSFFCLFLKPLPKIYVGKGVLYLTIYLSCFLNLLTYVLVSDRARYESGGLVSGGGGVYFFAVAASLVSMILILKSKFEDVGVGLKTIVVFCFFYALTVDGLAKVLTLASFLYLYWYKKGVKARYFLFFPFLFMGLMWYGIHEKFSEIPDYFSGNFFSSWVIARFSIPAEQAYTYLSGHSIVGEFVSYWDLISRAMFDRFSLLTGDYRETLFPRTISEAFYYDVHHVYGGGSSPGLFLGTLVQGGWLFWIVPLLISFLMIQYFYKYKYRISFFQICAYSFLLKPVYSNVAEYFVVISFVLFIALCFFLASLVSFVPERDGECLSMRADNGKY